MCVCVCVCVFGNSASFRVCSPHCLSVCLSVFTQSQRQTQSCAACAREVGQRSRCPCGRSESGQSSNGSGAATTRTTDFTPALSDCSLLPGICPTAIQTATHPHSPNLVRTPARPPSYHPRPLIQHSCSVGHVCLAPRSPHCHTSVDRSLTFSTISRAVRSLMFPFFTLGLCSALPHTYTH
jgi:hypothetical protein